MVANKSYQKITNEQEINFLCKIRAQPVQPLIQRNFR